VESVENPRTVSHPSHRPWKSRHSGGIPTFPQLRRRSLFLREGKAKALPKPQRPKVGQIKPPEMGQKKLPKRHLASFRERKSQLELELRRLAEAVALQDTSGFLLEALAERERELRKITDCLLEAGPWSANTELSDIRKFVAGRLADLRTLLSKDVSLARIDLAKHVKEIRMKPTEMGAERFYIAEGEWNLLGSLPGTGPKRQPSDWRVRMVVGAGFEPATFGL
jgi:hypothetical protein